MFRRNNKNKPMLSVVSHTERVDVIIERAPSLSVCLRLASEQVAQLEQSGYKVREPLGVFIHGCPEEGFRTKIGFAR